MSTEIAKRGVGKPRYYETPDELQQRVDEYLDACGDAPITTAGLARALGFRSRQSLYDYRKRDGFGEILDDALLLIEERYEQRLSGNNPTGAIFALKNFGWSDRQDLHHSGTIEVDVTAVRERLERKISDMGERLLPGEV